jgi:hypothetical protein
MKTSRPTPPYAPLLPVAVGVFEVLVPADILEYEMERSPEETGEEFEVAKAVYGALFGAALSKLIGH